MHSLRVGTVRPVASSKSRMRFLALLVCSIAFVGLVGCDGQSASRTASSTSTTRHTGTTSTQPPIPEPGDALVSFQDFSAGPGFELTFSHPRMWRESRYSMTSSFTHLIVYLSDADLHDPCVTTQSAVGETTRCAPPVAALLGGQVLVSWSNVGFPRPGPEIPHPTTRIGGQPAEIATKRTPECDALGGEMSITADIARPRGNHYEMIACLRGPNLALNKTLVLRMLDSTRVTG